MPVLVQNTQAGPAVLSDGTNKLALEWQGKGDPSGGDVQYVPDDVVDMVQFVKAVRQGIFVVVEASDEVKAKLDIQSQQFAKRQAAQDEAAKASIEHTANNDFVSFPCVGPADRGAGTCDRPVPVREKTKDDSPILCDRHQSLAGEYVQVDTGVSVEKGDALVPVKKWVRASLGARETA